MYWLCPMHAHVAAAARGGSATLVMVCRLMRLIPTRDPQSQIQILFLQQAVPSVAACSNVTTHSIKRASCALYSFLEGDLGIWWGTSRRFSRAKVIQMLLGFCGAGRERTGRKSATLACGTTSQQLSGQHISRAEEEYNQSAIQ